jgi:hypothetical protein
MAIYLLVCLIVQACTAPAHSVSSLSEREVLIISGGRNFGTGHHVIRIDRSGVKIDTAYFAEEFELLKDADSLFFAANFKTTHIDIAKAVSSKYIYKQLLYLSLDTVKAYERRSRELSQKYTCAIHEIQIIEADSVHNLRFFIPLKLHANDTEEFRFLAGLSSMFPFVAGERMSFREFYK